jgi:hypothetical protein
LLESPELKRGERWAVGIGIGALVIALAGLIVAAWTLHIFHRQYVEMQNQTKLFQSQATSAETDSRNNRRRTRQQIRLAESNISTIQEQIRLDQRAWLSIVNLQLIKEPVANENIAIQFADMNNGKSPAEHVSVKYRIDIKPNEPPVGNWSTVKVFPQHVIFPGTSLSKAKATASGVTKELADSYNGHHDRLFIRVRVDYRDVFGNPLWTEICSSHGIGEDADDFSGCLVGGTIDHEK